MMFAATFLLIATPIFAQEDNGFKKYNVVKNLPTTDSSGLEMHNCFAPEMVKRAMP